MRHELRQAAQTNTILEVLNQIPHFKVVLTERSLCHTLPTITCTKLIPLCMLRTSKTLDLSFLKTNFLETPHLHVRKALEQYVKTTLAKKCRSVFQF